jgi:uncharacterized protein YijF (DUF1287 family)
METIEVKSRIIVSMQYDKARQYLSLEFRNGQRRLFTGVPRHVVLKMARSASPGEFYIENVRAQFEQLAA